MAKTTGSAPPPKGELRNVNRAPKGRALAGAKPPLKGELKNVASVRAGRGGNAKEVGGFHAKRSSIRKKK